MRPAALILSLLVGAGTSLVSGSVEGDFGTFIEFPNEDKGPVFLDSCTPFTAKASIQEAIIDGLGLNNNVAGRFNFTWSDITDKTKPVILAQDVPAPTAAGLFLASGRRRLRVRATSTAVGLPNTSAMDEVIIHVTDGKKPLLASLEDANRKVEVSRASLDEQTAALTRLDKDTAAINRAIESLNARIDKKSGVLDDIENKASAVADELARVEALYNANKASIRARVREAAALRSSIPALDKENAQLEKELFKIEGHITEATVGASSAGGSSGGIEGLRASVDRLTSKRASLEAQVSSLESQKRKAQDAAKDFETKTKQAKTAAIATLQALHQANSQIKAKVSNEKTILVQLEKTLAAAAGDLKNAQAKSNGLTAAIKSDNEKLKRARLHFTKTEERKMKTEAEIAKASAKTSSIEQVSLVSLAASLGYASNAANSTNATAVPESVLALVNASQAFVIPPPPAPGASDTAALTETITKAVTASPLGVKTAALETETGDLENDGESMKRNIKKAVDDERRAKTQTDQAQDSLEKAQQRLKKIKAELDGQQKRIAFLQQSIKAQTAQVEDTRDKLIPSANVSLAKSKKELETLKAEVHKLERRKKEAEREVIRWQGMADDLEEQENKLWKEEQQRRRRRKESDEEER